MNLLSFKNYSRRHGERFSLPRLLVKLDFISNLGYLYFYIKLLPNKDTTEQVTFYTLQLIFVIIASILNYARFSETYYFPLLKEMPENIYWSFVLVFLFLLRIPFIRGFIPSSENQTARYLHLTFAVLVIWQIV